MKIKNLLLVCMALMTVGLAACQTAAQTPMALTPPPTAVPIGKPVTLANGIYTDISVAELQGILAKKDFKLINVHIPFEGNLPNTDLSIPYNEIDKNVKYLPADKAAKLVLYCRTGHMSALAAETLVNMGYTNVLNLVGGMDAWQAAGLTINK